MNRVVESRWRGGDFCRNSGRRGTLASCIAESHMVTTFSFVSTAQSCEEKNVRENGYECEWRYNSCMPACPVTCQHPEPLACPVQCVEGCHAHCPPGEASLAGAGWRDGGMEGWVLRQVCSFFILVSTVQGCLPLTPSLQKKVCLRGSLCQSQGSSDATLGWYHLTFDFFQ